MTHPPTLVLVTGLPGTGKSTVATIVADIMQTSVLGHDWAMSALRDYQPIQDALGEIELGHRIVGWSILTSLGRAQLVEGRSVVLDGVARAAQRAHLRAVADSTGARFVVITTRCTDAEVHRARIDGRRRHIPNWYELRWEDVERSAATWEDTPGDLDLDSVDSPADQASAIRRLLSSKVS